MKTALPLQQKFIDNDLDHRYTDEQTDKQKKNKEVSVCVCDRAC